MKRKLHKLLSLLIVFSTLLANTAILTTVYSQEDVLSENQMLILDAFDCVEEGIESDSVVTRGQFANLLSKIATPIKSENLTPKVVFSDIDEQSEYYEAVYLLNSLGVVLGNGTGNFNPDDKVTQYQASVMALRLLGYADAIPENEYGQFIARKALFKSGVGLNNSDVTYEKALKLLYDILYADVSSLYDGSGNVNFMNYVLNLYEISGKVTNDGRNTFKGVSTEEKNYIFINEYPYETDKDYSGWLGYKVFGLVEKNSDGYGIYTLKEKNNNITKITATRLLEYDNYTYKYEDKNNDEKELKLKTDLNTVYVYNGTTVSIDDKFDKTLLKPEVGMITGVDNDNDDIAEVVNIDDYSCGLVSVWDKNSDKVIFKHNKKDMELATIDYSIKDFDGNDVDGLTENNVVWIGYDLKKENVKIVVSKAYAEGVIQEISGEYVTLEDGAKYRWASSIDTNDRENINLGENYILRLDPAGDIAFVESNIDTTYNRVGFLVGSKNLGSALSEKYAVRIYTVEGEMTDFNLNSKRVKVLDESGILSVFSTKKAFDKLVDYNEGLITYSIDVYGDINSVTLPYSGSENDKNQLNLVFETVEDSSEPNYYSDIYYKNYNYDGNTILDSNSKMFYIPTDRNSENDYRISSPGSLANGYYLSKVFNFDSKSVMGEYMVVYARSTDSLSFSDYAYVISGMYEVWDSDREEVRRIVEIGKDRKQYYLRDLDSYKNVPAAIDESDVRQVEVGDIVRLATSNDEILGMRLIYDANGSDFTGRDGNIAGAKIEQFDITQKNSQKFDSDKSFNMKGNPVAISSDSVQPNAYRFGVGNDQRYIEGYIVSQYGNALTLTTQNLRQNQYNSLWNVAVDNTLRVEDNNSYLTQSFKLSDFVIVDLDTNDGRTVDVRSVSSVDIKTYEKYGSECSKAVYISRYGDYRGAFIYIGHGK